MKIDRQMDRLITLPLAHAHRVISLATLSHARLVHNMYVCVCDLLLVGHQMACKLFSRFHGRAHCTREHNYYYSVDLKIRATNGTYMYACMQ